MMQAKKKQQPRSSKLLSQLLTTVDAHASTEARQRQEALRLCSELLSLDEPELWREIESDQVQALRANLHNLLRRLETDAAVVTAVLAQLSSGPDDDDGLD
jgi:hypothetical protein